jgi:hypothetical protein
MTTPTAVWFAEREAGVTLGGECDAGFTLEIKRSGAR